MTELEMLGAVCYAETQLDEALAEIKSLNKLLDLTRAALVSRVISFDDYKKRLDEIAEMTMKAKKKHDDAVALTEKVRKELESK